MRPNYKKIYQDMLKLEYPDKLKDPKIKELLGKADTSEDVLKFNDRLFKPSERARGTIKTEDL
jgi:hypothetical protein